MNTATLLILAGIVLLVLLIVSKGLIIIQQSETMIIERLGRYHATLRSGINLIIPFIDKPRRMMERVAITTVRGAKMFRTTEVTRIDLREKVYNFEKQGVITQDNVMPEISAVLYYQIVDPKSAVYEISNLPIAIEMLTQTSLRNIIGAMDLDETLTSRDKINHSLLQILDEASKKWGVKVNRVEIQDIEPPLNIRDAMEKQMRAERDKRAQILTAEGEKEATIRESEGKMQEQINHAEGKKQAQILAAQAERESKVLKATGEAEAIKRIAEAVTATNADPTQYLIAMRYLETLETMGESNNAKQIFLPYEATGILAALGGIKEIATGKLPPLK